MSYWGTIKPRRRKLTGRQKILYSDLDSPMNNSKINLVEKQQFIEEFKLKKEQEKKQRLILIIVLVAFGIIGISLMSLVKVA